MDRRDAAQHARARGRAARPSAGMVLRHERRRRVADVGDVPQPVDRVETPRLRRECPTRDSAGRGKARDRRAGSRRPLRRSSPRSKRYTITRSKPVIACTSSAAMRHRSSTVFADLQPQDRGPQPRVERRTAASPCARGARAARARRRPCRRRRAAGAARRRTRGRRDEHDRHRIHRAQLVARVRPRRCAPPSRRRAARSAACRARPRPRRRGDRRDSRSPARSSRSGAGAREQHAVRLDRSRDVDRLAVAGVEGYGVHAQPLCQRAGERRLSV